MIRDEYSAKKQDLSSQEVGLKLYREPTGEKGNEIYETIENVAYFITHARTLFQNGEPDVKRLIAKHLASGYVLNNGKDLQIELISLFEPVRSSWEKVEFKNPGIEHQKTDSQSRLEGENCPGIQIWCARFIKYRTWLRKCELTLTTMEIKYHVHHET